VLPDTAKEKPQRGKVTAVGAGRLLKSGKRAPINLKVGDQILFGKYAGTEVTVNDVEFKILRENEVLARCD
jgi:chaperonin GroES